MVDAQRTKESEQRQQCLPTSQESEEGKKNYFFVMDCVNQLPCRAEAHLVVTER